MVTALKHYNSAANDGCFHFIKRLQDYWVKRSNDEFYKVIAIGDKVNERRSVYFEKRLISSAIVENYLNQHPEPEIKMLQSY